MPEFGDGGWNEGPTPPNREAMNEDKLAPPPTGAPTPWTRAEAYLASLARRRTARRRREPEPPRTQPETPRLSLSILPILALLAALALFAAAIVIDAWPGRERPRAQPKAEPSEYGTAPPGWLEQAKRERRQVRPEREPRN